MVAWYHSQEQSPYTDSPSLTPSTSSHAPPHRHKTIDNQALGPRTDAKHAAAANGKFLLTIHFDLELAGDHGADARLRTVGGELERGAGGDGLRRDRDVPGEADGLADGDVRGEVWGGTFVSNGTGEGGYAMGTYGRSSCWQWQGKCGPARAPSLPCRGYPVLLPGERPC